MEAHDRPKVEGARSNPTVRARCRLTATSQKTFAADCREDKEFVVNATTAAGEARESYPARSA